MIISTCFKMKVCQCNRWTNLLDVSKSGFKQDEAPPHCSLEAGNGLDVNFSHSWIGRLREIEYPPRPPDLTPGFFLCRTFKTTVCLANEIFSWKTATTHRIFSPELLRKAHGSVEKRVGNVRNIVGHHFKYPSIPIRIFQIAAFANTSLWTLIFSVLQRG